MMSYQPSVPVGACNNCGGFPSLDAPLFQRKVRLVCVCGVSGAWTTPKPWDLNMWNVAARGWVAVSHDVPRPSRPNPTEK